MAWLDGRKNVHFLRWRGERYIPKNVFFLREEVLIYDAPSLPRKDDRFDQ